MPFVITLSLAAKGGIWQELGVSAGTAILVLIALYFIVKWAVKNGVKEALRSYPAIEQHPEEGVLPPSTPVAPFSCGQAPKHQEEPTE